MTNRWLNEIVVAIWASASFYIIHFAGAEGAAPLIFPLLAGAITLVLLTYKKPVIATVSPLVSLGAFLLNLSILASYLFNAHRYDWVFIAGNILSSLLLFFSLYLITMRIDLDFRKTLVLTSIFVNLLLPIILVTAPVTWGRVDPPENPNYVGMMALVAFIGALSARSIVWAATLSALPLYSMVVLESRDSLLAAGIALMFAVVSWTWRHRSKEFSTYCLLAFFGGMALCAVMTLTGFDVLNPIGKIFDGLFMLDDKYRGLATGGSGRDDLWAAAISLWEAEPVFGVGFKGHTLLMPDQMPAHNAYLGMLADMGVAGLASYLLMMSEAISFVFKPIRRLLEYPLSATIIVTYIVYGSFEVRAFSFGNTYSVLFLLVVFNCSKRRLA
ncbi:MAG: O-antigen ligase family protein [Verrucomicrobia bacterium]|nr:O-antigen ligase family protein [Verrucomicrobiota bacterium]MBV8481991.1 O-antigen ligase family protein [Verrucomicrobiota bacterium]